MDEAKEQQVPLDDVGLDTTETTPLPDFLNKDAKPEKDSGLARLWNLITKKIKLHDDLDEEGITLIDNQVEKAFREAFSQGSHSLSRRIRSEYFTRGSGSLTPKAQEFLEEWRGKNK